MAHWRGWNMSSYCKFACQNRIHWSWLEKKKEVNLSHYVCLKKTNLLKWNIDSLRSVLKLTPRDNTCESSLGLGNCQPTWCVGSLQGPIPQLWGHSGVHKLKAWDPGLARVSWFSLGCYSSSGLQWPMATGRHCCSPQLALVSTGRPVQWNISCCRNWSAKCNPLGSTRPSKALTLELRQTNSGITNIVDFAHTKCHFLWAFILSLESRFKGKHKY